MSSGCGDVLSLADLQTAKKHQLFEAEVITGKQGGVAGGADIDYATNQVTGQVQKTLPAVLRDAGFTPASFTFQTGGTLSENDRNKVVYDSASSAWYSWAGALPKVIAAGTNPLLDSNWKPQTDPNLRNNLAASDGEKLIGEAANIAALRTIEPTYDKQRITLREHTAGTGKGGGQFRAVLAGSSYTDNNGTIIKTAGGAAWLRIGADILNPLMFGAVGNGTTDDAQAVQKMLDVGAARSDLLGFNYAIGTTIYNQHANKHVMRGGSFKYLSGIGGQPMMRLKNAFHEVYNVSFDGTGSTTSIGILWEGANARSGKVHDCEFKNIGAQGLYVSGDYTNNLYASYGSVKNIRLIQCGNSATANGRASVGFDGVSDFIVDGVFATNCNWGIYFRNDLGIAGVSRASNNKLINSEFRGSGRTHPTFTDAQGISASFQDNLQLNNVTVSDFADNGIDMQFCDASIVSNWRVTNCKDGVFMGDRDCRRHVITDGVALDCDRAARLVTDGTYTTNTQLAHVKINNVHAYNPKFEGFRLVNTGKSLGASMYAVQVSDCSCDASGSYTLTTQTHGMHIQGGLAVTAINFNVYNVRQHGIYVKDSEMVQIMRCMMQNVDRVNGGNSGVYADTDCVRVSVSDVTVFGGSSATAVTLAGGAGHSAKHIRWRGVTNGVVSSGATSPYLFDNTSF